MDKTLGYEPRDVRVQILLELQMEVVRMDEELVLKTSGCKRFGGSIPFASAKYGDVPNVGKGVSLLN